MLASEIRELEGRLEAPGLSPGERRGALVRLAWLFRLSGNIEAAAGAWTAGAYADPASRDDQALLEGALCYITLGEFEKADANIRPALISSQDPAILKRARYIGAQIELFRIGQSQALYSLLESPDFLDYRPPIYYTFWRIYGDRLYRDRLLEEFPTSPEAAVLRNEGAAGGSVGGPAGVSAVPHALWFFFPGRDQVTLSAPVETAPRVSAAQSAPVVPGPAPTAPPLQPGPVQAGPAAVVPGSVTPAPQAASGGPRAIQIGLFSRENNARNMADRLRAAGFIPEVAARVVNGASYWSVTVPPGDDSSVTTLRLKDAGFESFPVF
jgi:cell division septation protein DedD